MFEKLLDIWDRVLYKTVIIETYNEVESYSEVYKRAAEIHHFLFVSIPITNRKVGDYLKEYPYI